MVALKRNIFLSIGAVIILALAVISFVFIPAMGQSAGKPLVFGKWNGKPVEYSQDSFFTRQFSANLEREKQQNREITDFTYYQAMQNAFQIAVIRLAVQDELQRSGYILPPATLNAALINLYTDATGKYSSKVYNETSEMVRASNRRLMSDDLTYMRYLDDIRGTPTGVYGFKNSSKEVEFIKGMAGAERSFTYVALPVAEYPDSEVEKYVRENADLFARHNLSMITFDSEDTAKRTASSIKKGELTFDDALAAWSTRVGTDADGLILKSLRSDLNAAFADAKDLDAILSLAPDTVSNTVTFNGVSAIVRANGPITPADPSSQELKTAAREWMTKNMKGRIEDYALSRAASFAESAREAGFSAAARQAGLTTKTTTPFPLNLGNSPVLNQVPVSSHPELSEAVNSDSFFRTAFSLQPQQVSAPVLLDSYVLVLALNEERSADSQERDLLAMLYDNYTTQWFSNDLTDYFLKSPKLEDNFLSIYLTHFFNN